MMKFRFAAALAAVALGAVGCAGREPAVRHAAGAPDMAAEAAQRGQRLAVQTCGGCHAVDNTGASPLPAATPFRDIVQQRSLARLEEGFAAGLVTSHPAMPPFNFRAGEIDDLIAYLETLKARSSGGV